MQWFILADKDVLLPVLHMNMTVFSHHPVYVESGMWFDHAIGT